MHKNLSRGFTIVELLIVIAVIGILARLTIVAYRGVNNRAYDNSVRNDLEKYAGVINVYFSDNARYPISSAELQTLTAVKFSKPNYSSTLNSVAYCVGGATNGQAMVVIGRSISGISFYALNEDPVKSLGASTFPTNAQPLCEGLGVSTATLVWVHTAPSTWLPSV